jgi:hypothetical protein
MKHGKVSCKYSKYSRTFHIGFWWGNLRKEDSLKDPSVDGRSILKWIFNECDSKARTELNSLRIETGGGLLRMQY